MDLREVKINHVIGEKCRITPPAFLAGCVVGTEMYFASWLDKGFYKMDLYTGVCTFLKLFERENECTFLYNQAIYYKNAIWFIPANYGSYIVKVDLATLDMNYFSLPKDGKEIRDKDGVRYRKFKCCYKENASVFWLIPIGFNMFLKVDMESEDVIEIYNLRKQVEFKDGVINFSDACMVENEIWICPREMDKLVVFDTVTSEIRFVEWKNKENSYQIIRSYKNWILLFSYGPDKTFVMIHKNTLEEKKVSITGTWKETNKLMHLAVEVIGQYAFFVPFQAHEYIVIDLETGEMQSDIRLHEYMKEMEWGMERYQTGIHCDTKIFYVSDMPRVPLTVYDTRENTICCIEKSVEKGSYNQFIKEFYKNDKSAFINWFKTNNPSYYLETDVFVNICFPVFEELKNKEEMSHALDQEAEGGKIWNTLLAKK